MHPLSGVRLNCYYWIIALKIHIIYIPLFGLSSYVFHRHCIFRYSIEYISPHSRGSQLPLSLRFPQHSQRLPRVRKGDRGIRLP